MSSERTRDPRGDPSSEPIGTLHVVLLSHLDTQWRWTERDTIERFLAATVDANELLFDRFPFYLLSFEGAYRYRLLAEHDPARFGRVAARVRAGRWHVAGAPLDAFDANLPAPESILRHLLYGSRWLERHLGVVPRELLLPDCFGFPASLPTLAVHAGLHGFSTQKLQKGAEVRVAFGVPFHYGLWIGPDGSTLPSVLDPGEYGKPPARWPGDDPATAAAFESLRAAGRPPRRMAYFGIGDKGGALAPAAVARLDAAAHPTTSVEVAVGRSDAIFEATPPDERDRLPRYRGDLLLRRHGVGCYSAQTAMKRWNRANERLARAAELAASLAARLGRPYPAARLEGAWTRFLVRQMHDDLTGTSIPAAYRLSHGDEALAANDFCEVLLDSLSTVATRLDRSGPGRPVLIFDPYAGRRDGLVEIGVDLGEEERIGSVRDAEGAPLPFQIARRSRGRARLLVPWRSDGAAASLLYLSPDPVRQETAERAEIAPHEGGFRLRAGALRATIDASGDLVSFVDGDRELVAAPVGIELLPDRPRRYPAWEIDWRDHSAAPRARLGAPAELEIFEEGPLRVALMVKRKALGSRFVEVWRLAAGRPWIEAESRIVWRTRGALATVRVPTTVESPEMLCDLGVGVAPRPVASEALYEVPAFRWSALASETGGLALLCDERAGRSHPDPRTLRLTLLHSPATIRRFPHQATQDFGRHRVRFALAPLPAEGAAGRANALAEDWVTKPIAFAVDRAAGGSGAAKRFALVDLGDRAEALQALKRAEDSERLVVRLRETTGEASRVRIDLGAPVVDVAALDAIERPAAPPLPPEEPLPPPGGARLEVALRPWSLRTLAIGLAEPPASATIESHPLPLVGRRRGFSRDGESLDSGFDGHGRSFPLELAPATLEEGPVPFDLSHLAAGGGVRDADGGTLRLPTGFAELWLLGAAGGDESASVRFTLGARTHDVEFPSWRRPLAAPTRQLFDGRPPLGIERRAGWARRAPLVWYATHLHDRRGRNLAGERGLLFALRLPLDGAGGELGLPLDPRLRLVAATLAVDPARTVRESLPLFFTFG